MKVDHSLFKSLNLDGTLRKRLRNR